MIIASPSVHWFRSLTIGGDQITAALVKQFKLTHAQAELLKREPHRARRMSQLYAVIDPLLESLVSEINRSLDTFQQLYPDQTISRVYGSGAGFPLHGLWRTLRQGK
jgi:Tfp pilus assembly PilM family ATPase